MKQVIESYDLESTDVEVDDETFLAGRAEKWGTARQPKNLNPFLNGPAPVRRSEALRLVGQVLYAARMPDGVIKIGCTGNLQHRLHDHDNPELLAIKAGDRTEEATVHHSLAAYIHHGREWYFPTPEVLAIVNQWRTDLGMEPLAA